jgi:predicted cobalt transporter CbtA
MSGLLLRGMLVGIVAGLLAFGFAKLVGEPQIERAIAFESAHQAMHMAAMQHGAPAAEEEPELVGRGTQAGVGLLTGILLYGMAMGGLFSLIFAYAHGRLGPASPRALAALIAAAAFLALVVIPGLKYPANPPSVGHPDTIGLRTQLFFAMLALSLAATVAAVAAGRRLLPRFGAWNAALIAGAGFLLVIAGGAALLPDLEEVPAGFPAVTLWQFRIAALGVQLVLWAALGLLFGWLTERNNRAAFRP